MNNEEPDVECLSHIAEIINQAEIFEEAAPSKANKRQSKSQDDKEPKQVDVLLEISREAFLFHDGDGVGYADIVESRKRTTWPFKSANFKNWLLYRYFQDKKSAPNSESLTAAINTMIAKANFEGPEYPVFLRTGEFGGKLYLDLADDEWRMVEIDGLGWRVTQDVPVRFRRNDSMRPLPIPQPEGSIDLLRPFINTKTEENFVLAITWLLAAFRPCGPYPLLALAGEQGSSKSTFSALMRSLIDPNSAPLRSLPREIRDLYVSAKNGHILAFDNISGLSGWISDSLCRMATGGGFAVRGLYTDDNEVIFEAMRPIIVNGIGDMIERADLADRALVLTLEAIPEDKRRPAADLWAAFEAVRPQILGALLDGVVEGLRRLPEIQLQRLPRMADFAKWATACETAYWPAGSFQAAYTGNQQTAVADVVDADPVANAVRQLLTDKSGWEGTASDLLIALSGIVGERISKGRGWPDSARALSGQLRRTATFLRKMGIESEFIRQGRNGTRMIRLYSRMYSQDNPSIPSAASVVSVVSVSEIPRHENNELEHSTTRTNADGNKRGPNRSVGHNALINGDNESADGADGRIQEIPDDVTGRRAFGDTGPILWGDGYDQIRMDHWLEKNKGAAGS